MLKNLDTEYKIDKKIAVIKGVDIGPLLNLCSLGTCLRSNHKYINFNEIYVS